MHHLQALDCIPAPNPRDHLQGIFLCGADRLGTSTDMKDSGYILVGFLGVSAGKPKASFVGVDGAARKAGSALVG